MTRIKIRCVTFITYIYTDIAQLKIGGVLFFVDVELVLNVEGDIVVWSPPDSFNLHLVSGQEWTYPAGRSWS